MTENENHDWVENQWTKIKQEFPVGHKLYGCVIAIKPFGVFLDIGYKVIDGYKLSGIIDIGTKSDEDSSGLPMDNSLWPKIGEKVYCKVVWHRDSIKEVSLSIINQ
jgi:ribosomal protein S1